MSKSFLSKKQCFSEIDLSFVHDNEYGETWTNTMLKIFEATTRFLLECMYKTESYCISILNNIALPTLKYLCKLNAYTSPYCKVIPTKI